jgi:hypothetical protein
MILYINGDSHSAGAQSVNDFCFANDDFSKVALGRKPHPDNLNASYGMHLSKMLKLALVCDAEAGCSNERILRTTYDYVNKINTKQYNFIVIGWTNWTRTEWYDEELNEMIQINASFPNTALPNMQTKFKQYVTKLDFKVKQLEWHDRIYQLHLDLNEKKIPHLFFNANDDLKDVPNNLRKNWDNSYINPYDPKSTYIETCVKNGYKHNEWYHFKQDAHLFWAQYLFNWLTTNNISV